MANEASNLLNAAGMKDKIASMIMDEILKDHNIYSLLNQRNMGGAVQKRNLAGETNWATFGGSGGTTVGE